MGASQIAPEAIIVPASRRVDCEVTAVACRDEARGKAFAAQHGIAAVETQYQTLVERSDVDLVYNALPPSRHADMSIAALHAGKAVLCEKPFAMNAAEAAQMLQAAQETGGLLIEAFHYRHHPAFQRCLEKVRSGEIGRVKSLHAIFVAPVPYRLGEVRHTLSIGGGALMDMGCYPIHWVRTLMGQEPSVSSAHVIQSQPDIDLTTKAELSFDGGVTASIECSMDDSRRFEAALTITGEAGEIHMHNPLAPHAGHEIRTRIDGVETVETCVGATTYDLQLTHVLAVMRQQEEAFLGGKDAVANMHVIDQVYRAAGMRPRCGVGV